MNLNLDSNNKIKVANVKKSAYKLFPVKLPVKKLTTPFPSELNEKFQVLGGGNVKEEVEKSSQPKLVQRASEIASYITGDAWSGFILDDDQRIQVRQGGVSIDQDSLSAGSKDVLRLAIRLAVAEMHREKNDIALPIFLDDPTASIDDVRAPRLFEVLKKFSEHHQLIMTTHDVRSSAQAVAVGAVQISMD